MLANIIYLVVFIILAFVLSIAVKAITRGVEAKQTLKEEKNFQVNKEENEIKLSRFYFFFYKFWNIVIFINNFLFLAFWLKNNH